MKRHVILVLLTFVVIGGVAASAVSAKRAGGRTVVRPYAPNPYEQIVVHYLDPGISIASVELAAGRGEQEVTVAISDESNTPARGALHQSRQTIATFCGATDHPIGIDPSEPLIVEVFTGACNGAPSVATRGAIEVTFFRGNR